MTDDPTDNAHLDGTAANTVTTRADQLTNIRSLDEWRQIRRNRPEGQRGAAWMRRRRRQRPHARGPSYAAAGRTPAEGPGRHRGRPGADFVHWGEPHFRYGQRYRPGRVPQADAKPLFSVAARSASRSGRTRGERVVSAIVWLGGALLVGAALLWWQAWPPRTLPEPSPPQMWVWAREAGPPSAINGPIDGPPDRF